MGTFHPLILITGRAGPECLFVELRAVLEPLVEAAPPHAWHCLVGEPTTDQKTVADLAKLSIVFFKRVHRGEDASIADGFGTPADPDTARLASEVIDEALRSALERSSSPGLRRILGDVRQERSGGAGDPPLPSPPAPPVQPTSLPPQPGFGRRTGGFGRKGL